MVHKVKGGRASGRFLVMSKRRFQNVTRCVALNATPRSSKCRGKEGDSTGLGMAATAREIRAERN